MKKGGTGEGGGGEMSRLINGDTSHTHIHSRDHIHYLSTNTAT